MSRGLRVVRRGLLPAVVLALPAVAICLAFWPGHMNADTIAEIQEVRWNLFSDVYAPQLLWLWGHAWPLVGPGWVFIAQVAVFMVGLYLVLRAAFRPVPAALLAALIAASPPALNASSTPCPPLNRVAS